MDSKKYIGELGTKSEIPKMRRGDGQDPQKVVVVVRGSGGSGRPSP